MATPHWRMVIAVVIAALAIPVTVLALVDPLEGGIALLVCAAMVGIARLLGRVPLPKLAWIPWLCAVAVGSVALVAAVLPYWGEIDRPRGRDALTPTLVVLLVVYEGAVLLTLAGAVQYLIRLVRRLRLD
jgi:hypothetical protein